MRKLGKASALTRGHIPGAIEDDEQGQLVRRPNVEMGARRMRADRIGGAPRNAR